VVAVADDFGRVRIYRFPNAQTEAESLELLGHSSHVTGVTFLPGQRLVSTGGIEGSILQWKAVVL
jgi:WD40 repeat protein